MANMNSIFLLTDFILRVSGFTTVGFSVIYLHEIVRVACGVVSWEMTEVRPSSIINPYTLKTNYNESVKGILRHKYNSYPSMNQERKIVRMLLFWAATLSH